MVAFFFVIFELSINVCRYLLTYFLTNEYPDMIEMLVATLALTQII